jgi:hypothetical protein
MLQSGKSDVVVLDEEDAEKGTTEGICFLSSNPRMRPLHNHSGQKIKGKTPDTF